MLDISIAIQTGMGWKWKEMKKDKRFPTIWKGPTTPGAKKVT